MSTPAAASNTYYICRYGSSQYGVVVADHYKRVIIQEANGTYRDASGQTDTGLGYSTLPLGAVLAEVTVLPGGTAADVATPIKTSSLSADTIGADDALVHIPPRALVQPFTHWIFYSDVAEQIECGDVKRNDSTYITNRIPNTPDPGGTPD